MREEPPIKLHSAPQPDCEVREEVQEPIKKSEDSLEALKRHNVTFNFADVGCTISIGCRRYCFSDNIVALEEFIKYVKNTEEAYEKWNK